jgi:hypothetical protein
MKYFLLSVYFCLVSFCLIAQQKTYWNEHTKLVPFRLPPPPLGFEPKRVDLDNDGNPDAIYSMTHDSIPVLWLDDNHNMKWTDMEGDLISDCLLIDRNRDGIYGGQGDLIVDWIDTNNDGRADMQIVVEYPKLRTGEVWPNGHYMIVLDLDKDNIFNYVDWGTFEIQSWDKSGVCDFYPDYSGQSAFMKIHTSTYDINDLRLSWENPFLFYDEDGDGLTEMAIRMVDSPKIKDKNQPENSYVNRQLTGFIDWVSMAIDMDNDNAPGNEFDYDFTIGFQGKGFNYGNQIHKFNNPIAPKSDIFFMDPRFRHLNELVYTDHDSALKLIFKGDWNRVNFVWDEDGDNKRWERVEFYDPLDPFKVGWKNGGIDNNKQSDAAGDRGEWDMDNSGKGKLYLSRFDGRIHLYGAEWGCWRIDQNAEYYEGWDRMWMSKDPKTFATVKYSDSDGNGFFDRIEYDLDGNREFKTIIDFKSLGIDDRCTLIDQSKMKYRDYNHLMKQMADQMWRNAREAVAVARSYGLETSWYAKLKQASSVQERYSKGYWLQFYIYKDLEHLFLDKTKVKQLRTLQQAYFSGNWAKMFKK